MSDDDVSRVTKHLVVERRAHEVCIAERDSALARVAALETADLKSSVVVQAELESFRRSVADLEERIRLGDRNLVAALAERDAMRDQLRVSDELRAAQDETVELNTVRRIAIWLDDMPSGDAYSCRASKLAAAIRCGMWRDGPDLATKAPT